MVDSEQSKAYCSDDEAEKKVKIITIDNSSNFNSLSTGIFGNLVGIFEDLNKKREGYAYFIVLRMQPIRKGEEVLSYSSSEGVKLEELVNIENGKYSPLAKDRLYGITLLGSKAIQKIRCYKKSIPLLVYGVTSGKIMGGALEMIASLSDIIISGKSSVYSLPEIKLGLVPAWGGIKYLQEHLTKSQLNYLLTGNPISAEKALQWGLVTEICEDSSAFERALAMARSAAKYDDSAVKECLKLLELSNLNDKQYIQECAISASKLMSREFFSKKVEAIMKIRKRGSR